MGDFMRAQIYAYLSTDPKKDRVTNTLHFRRDNSVDVGDFDWSGDARAILDAYKVGRTIYAAGCDRIGIRVYDLEDGEPRPPKAQHEDTVSLVGAGPREVALCLSYRSEVNHARQRGRIYLGPFTPSAMNDRPDGAIRTALLQLATRLGDVGGANIDWCVFSPTDFAQTGSLGPAFNPVKHVWVDDAWDTQRSRGLPPTLRASGNLNE